ncbi:MAG: thiamine phosphate synthase [bacterium]|nr:thiamine phosphate synthase [bacterium]
MVDFKIYLVTDRTQVPECDLVAALKEALDGGVKAVQLREKDLSDGEVFALAEALRQLCRRYGARLMINDRADIAEAVGADGVQLTQRSYSPREARRILGREKLIGVSTHSAAEAESAARGGADFVTLGPIFDTPSKRRYGPPIGIDLLRTVAAGINIPVFAIGGITPEVVPEVLDAGAFGVAMISGILGTGHIGKAAREFTLLTQREERAAAGDG